MRALLTFCFLLFGLSSTAVAQDGFRFVVFGDLQDETPEGRAADRELIDQINAAEPNFSVYIGDIKGGGACTDELNTDVRSIFDQHEAPLVFTPGDNEWTDCWRDSMGRFDPIERKVGVIDMFTVEGESIGQTPMPLIQQNGQRENARWSRDGVLFATFHITGSNNNLRQNRAAADEHFARSDKNLEWLDIVFQEADETGAKALVILIHANPQWDARWWSPTGFDRFRNRLAREAESEEIPILVVHGDTHTFRIDTPLRGIDNLTRLEVFGPPQKGAVIVDVDPQGAQMFRFSTIVVDAD